MTARCSVVVVGVSAGGMEALGRLVPGLAAHFPVPVVIVQHLAPDSDDYLPRWLDQRSALHVVQAQHGMALQPGCAYVAPPNYHLVFENPTTLAVLNDEKVNFSRPSIDVLFESAAEVFGRGAVAVVLTGANGDGAKGAAAVHKAGGRVVVQSPEDAQVDTMPRAAIALTQPDAVVPLDAMAHLLTHWFTHEQTD